MLKLCMTVALALSAGTAMAGTIATAENDSGGKIELTDIVLHEKSLIDFCYGTLLAKSYNRAGESIFGCWYPDESAKTNIVYWFKLQSTRTYPQEIFKVTDYGFQKFKEYEKNKHTQKDRREM